MFVIISVVITVIRFVTFMYESQQEQDNTRQEMLSYESCGNFMLWELR